MAGRRGSTIYGTTRIVLVSSILPLLWSIGETHVHVNDVENGTHVRKAIVDRFTGG